MREWLSPGLQSQSPVKVTGVALVGTWRVGLGSFLLDALGGSLPPLAPLRAPPCPSSPEVAELKMASKAQQISWYLSEGTQSQGSPCEEALGTQGRGWPGVGGGELQPISLPPCMVAQAINCLSSGCLPEPNAEACYLNFKITFFF